MCVIIEMIMMDNVRVHQTRVALDKRTRRQREQSTGALVALGLTHYAYLFASSTKENLATSCTCPSSYARAAMDHCRKTCE